MTRDNAARHKTAIGESTENQRIYASNQQRKRVKEQDGGSKAKKSCYDDVAFDSLNELKKCSIPSLRAAEPVLLAA